ncbi:hypothetical protein HUJ05_000592 [Dendroctonus ponderosae]|nr:hypothetical protein HUJ05_000592 [Dendroctonus ponderosae]
MDKERTNAQTRKKCLQINVALYFESLCPDSQNFLINQLYPTWNTIKDYVNIRFIPFGKSASKENGQKFTCQHGSQECKGNRIMSCALTRIPSQDLQVEYLRCFMDEYKFAIFGANENGQKCARLVNVDFEEMMSKCYQTREGTDLQLQAEADTSAVRPKFVPTIVYNEASGSKLNIKQMNGAFDQQLQDESVQNFRQTVCKLVRLYNIGNCT